MIIIDSISFTNKYRTVLKLQNLIWILDTKINGTTSFFILLFEKDAKDYKKIKFAAFHKLLLPILPMRKDVLYCHVHRRPGFRVFIFASRTTAKDRALYGLWSEFSQVFRKFIITSLDLAQIHLVSLKTRWYQWAYIHSVSKFLIARQFIHIFLKLWFKFQL